MGRFSNFSIWRGRLPHWRADDERYYVTFRHRRDLNEEEQRLLLRALIKPEGRQWNLLILCVLPNQTELIVTVNEHKEGLRYELSEIVEKAKTKAGKAITKKTGERFAPFYGESYDRIIRDEAEFEERWQAIFDSPGELESEDEEYFGLWVQEAPEN